MSIKSKTIIVGIVSLIIFGSITVLKETGSFSKKIEVETENVEQKIFSVMETLLRNDLSGLSMAVSAITLDRQANEFFMNREREKLADYFADYFKILKDEFGAGSLQRHQGNYQTALQTRPQV